MSIYYPTGTCSRQIYFTVKDDILVDVKFIGGCSGNLQAVSRLCIGKNIDEIISMLKDIQCRNKTSCPDQLALALLDYKAHHNQEKSSK